MRVSCEFALAVECCRRNFPSTDSSPILPKPGLDWGRFLRLARFHRIQGLVCAALAGEDLPEHARSALLVDAKEIAANNLQAASECALLRTNFERAGVDLLFVKGLTVSALAYQDAYVKMSADVDVLVEEDSAERAAELLTSVGYSLVLPPLDYRSGGLRKWHRKHKESVWCKAEIGVTLELHTRLSDNPALIPNLGMSSPRQLVPIGSRHSLPTLAMDDLLTYLCVHGASSAWFRMKWIADLAAVLHRRGHDSAERLHRSGQTFGAGRAPAQALLLARRLFSIPLRPSLQAELERDPINRLLATIALHELLQLGEPTERRLGTAWIHLTQPFLKPGWRFMASDATRQMANLLSARR